MGPKRTVWITMLYGARLTWLVLALLSDGGDAECTPGIRVRHNTVLTAAAGGELRIECPICFCSNPPPSVSWCRVIDSTANCVSLNETNHKIKWTDNGDYSGMSHLFFIPLSLNDSGQYRCEINNRTSVSHYITVSVSDQVDIISPDQENSTTTLEPDDSLGKPRWTYLYLSAGILGLVLFIIIISFLALKGCRGSRKPRKEKQENQYLGIPLTPQQSPSPSSLPRPQPCPNGVQPRPHGAQPRPQEARTHPQKSQPRPQGPQPLPELAPRLLPRQPSPTPLPDNVYDNAVYKQPARQQATPPHPSASSTGVDIGTRKAVKGQEGKRDRAREEEEGDGENLLVYAALNHQLFPRDAARLPRLRLEEASEYAAIRVT